MTSRSQTFEAPGGTATWRTMNLASTTASLSGPEAASSFSAGATSWLKPTKTARADPSAFARHDGAWSHPADPNRTYIGAWHNKIDRAMALSSLAELAAGQRRSRDEPPGQVRAAILDEVPFEPEPAPPPLSRADLARQIAVHRAQTKHSFARRREAGKPIEPPTAVRAADAVVPGWIPTGTDGRPVRHLSPPDESKLGRLEADMKRKFADSVTAPSLDLRQPRIDEMAEAQAVEFLRGNELFDKGDHLAALAEYEAALKVAALVPYVQLNRGNAFKALLRPVEAAACYQLCLDASPPRTEQQRLVHSLALLNLGLVREDEGRLQPAMQLYNAALALNPKCHLASKARGHMHVRNAQRLQASGVSKSVPPQYEMAFNMYGRTLDVDWQLPRVFRAGKLAVRMETRTAWNAEVYHFTSNLTCINGEYL